MTWDLKFSSPGQRRSSLPLLAQGGPSVLKSRRLSRLWHSASWTKLLASVPPSEETPPERQRRQRECSPLRTAALGTILWVTLWGLGCSSVAPQTLPTLPAGKPAVTVTDGIARDLRALPMDGDTVAVPRGLLVRIFGHLDAWRAWALALEHAGRWAK